MTDELQTEFETDDAAMEATWAKVNAPEPEVTPEVAPEATPEASQEATERARDEQGRFKASEAPDKQEAAEDAPEAEQQAKPDVPSNLPRAVRERWGELDDGLKDILQEQQNRLERVSAEAGQQKQAIGPIYDKVVQAAQEFPQLAQMKPAQIADEVFELARWANSLHSDPVSAILSIAQEKGVSEALKGKLGGESSDTVAGLQQQVATLTQQIQRMADPAAIRETVTQQLTENTVQSEIKAFSQSKADWAEVEPHLAQFIPVAREMKPGASITEILGSAYEMAQYALPNTRNRLLTERETEAARKRAQSVNVNSQGAASASDLTEDQQMEQIWARLQGA